MTPPTTSLAPPTTPVMVTIGLRPPTQTAGVLPVPLKATPIGDDEFQVIADLDEAAEAAECSCSAGDDQPYYPRAGGHGSPVRTPSPAGTAWNGEERARAL